MQFKTSQEVIDILGKTVQLGERISIHRDIEPKKNSIVRILEIDQIENGEKGYINKPSFYGNPDRKLDEHACVTFWCQQGFGPYIQVVDREIKRIIEIPPGIKRRPAIEG
ncbi:hypothetical protein KAU33_04205 [Candidatus Dependentiae bacterium]|nr:hypothetical protein [Candidatus Dependentiae bacterium]